MIYTKYFKIEITKGPRVCVNCSVKILKGQKCLNFTYAEGYRFQVKANLCGKCIKDVTVQDKKKNRR